MNPRIVFLGSPEFAVPTLQKLAESYNIVGVVTQPDRPAGRGRTLKPPAVKRIAQEIGLPFIQPPRVKEAEVMEQLRSWKPDLIVVAAFGQILPPELVDLPSRGCLNVHASLLPRWRGAAPIQAAILHGDKQTGVTIMRMDYGMDTGPILSQQPIRVSQEDTAASLGDRLANLGSELLIGTLPAYLNETIKPITQDSTRVTYAPRLMKEDGELDFSQSADVLERKVRAFHPWPGAYTFWQDQMLKIHQASAIQTIQSRSDLTPGKRIVYQGLPAIHTGYGILVLKEVQPAGKKSMPGKIYLQGARNWL